MIETRNLDATLAEVELRNAEDGTQTITGYAARFGVLSEDLGGFREKIRTGAFNRSLSETPDVIANLDHSTRAQDLLGRTSTGTLTLKSNGNGLYFEISPPDTQAARDIRAILARPNELRMSFAFSVAQGGERWKQEGDQTVRELLDVNLHDIALVVRPAYPQTEVALRSLNTWKKSSLDAYFRQKWGELSAIALTS